MRALTQTHITIYYVSVYIANKACLSFCLSVDNVFRVAKENARVEVSVKKNPGVFILNSTMATRHVDALVYAKTVSSSTTYL